MERNRETRTGNGPGGGLSGKWVDMSTGLREMEDGLQVLGGLLGWRPAENWKP